MAPSPSCEAAQRSQSVARQDRNVTPGNNIADQAQSRITFDERMTGFDNGAGHRNRVRRQAAQNGLRSPFLKGFALCSISERPAFRCEKRHVTNSPSNTWPIIRLLTGFLLFRLRCYSPCSSCCRAGDLRPARSSSSSPPVSHAALQSCLQFLSRKKTALAARSRCFVTAKAIGNPDFLKGCHGG